MITLINPNLVVQHNDIFTTGIVYMPVSLAYFAAAVRNEGFGCKVIDAFGERPNHYYIKGNFGFRGITPSEVADGVAMNSIAVVVYAGNITYHSSLVQIIQTVRLKFPKVCIILIENTQAVTAYSLRRIQKELYDIGVDYIVTGEAEERGIALLKALQNEKTRNNILNIDGIGFREKGKIFYTPPMTNINNLDKLFFPAWDLFPVQNYFRLKYAHGPFETGKYLPILTSRGCPYHCRFCIIPEMNKGKWRCRSAKNVVDEMEYHFCRFGVREFHIEDVNPTVNDKRTRQICNEIISRKLKIIWKISSGTKVETIKNEETIKIMVKAGCRYISISPETGSPEVLKKINKPFDLNHAVRMIKKMSEVGIRSQACFVLGYPGEGDRDRQMTEELVCNLTRAGVDEIALFIIAPVPGSDIFDQFYGYVDYSQLNFSPVWRDDYDKLSKFRLYLYWKFLIWKLRYYPWKIAKQAINFLTRRFETKMEMTPYRALHTFLLKAGLVGRRGKHEN